MASSVTIKTPIHGASSVEQLLGQRMAMFKQERCSRERGRQGERCMHERGRRDAWI
jgi:hypothetical protein